jgi:hypothetical protein
MLVTSVLNGEWSVSGPVHLIPGKEPPIPTVTLQGPAIRPTAYVCMCPLYKRLDEPQNQSGYNGDMSKAPVMVCHHQMVTVIRRKFLICSNNHNHFIDLAKHTDFLL